MLSFMRSGLVLVSVAVLAVGISTMPTRALEESKALQDRVDKLEKKIKKLETKLANVSLVKGELNGLAGPHVIFEGCNVHVRSGSGSSTDGTVVLIDEEIIPDTDTVGLGNLIVGYNEQPPTTTADRDGSHNLVVGPWHEYTSVCGAVIGQQHSSRGPMCTVLGGNDNNAQGYASSVLGGNLNAAIGETSTIGGGGYNIASGFAATVSGGFDNSASGNSATVSGGESGTAPGTSDWRGGGLFQDD